eukprot:8444550-Alexandrium_andersonii.AAC.1
MICQARCVLGVRHPTPPLPKGRVVRNSGHRKARHARCHSQLTLRRLRNISRGGEGASRSSRAI